MFQRKLQTIHRNELWRGYLEIDIPVIYTRCEIEFESKKVADNDTDIRMIPNKVDEKLDFSFGCGVNEDRQLVARCERRNSVKYR
jgi:hypothetical protein